MQLPPRSRTLIFTHHARAKMAFYKLSESRVRHVLHTPKRIEEGVAPKTVAMMQPAGTVKNSGLKSGAKGDERETWSNEIWVMFQEKPEGKTIISAWRYPGITKARSEIAKKLMHNEYSEFLSEEKKKRHDHHQSIIRK